MLFSSFELIKSSEGVINLYFVLRNFLSFDDKYVVTLSKPNSKTAALYPFFINESATPAACSLKLSNRMILFDLSNK